MADGMSVIAERIEDDLLSSSISLTDSGRSLLREILSNWEEEVREEAEEVGRKVGHEEAMENERICADDTMEDLETGIDLMKRGDPCAPTYLDRALRDLGSSYY